MKLFGKKFHHHRLLWGGLVMGFLTILVLALYFRSVEIKPDEVYLRIGIPDSAMVASILDVAPNAAGELLVSILAFDRLIKIDQVAPCIEIAKAYAQIPELTPIPLFLEDEDVDCYSYRLRFDIRDGVELLTLELALIHPATHIDLLQKQK